MSTPCLREECCAMRKQINEHWGPENSRLQTELAAAKERLAEIEAENARLRTAFLVNMLRLQPDLIHEEIERVIAGESIDAARKGKA